jgi:putative acetyltransferase
LRKRVGPLLIPKALDAAKGAVVIVRCETPDDGFPIREINIAAFKDHPFSRQTEHLIVDVLRDAGALELSLVAEVDGAVVGHVAFSAARIGAVSQGWFLLGPVAVAPAYQGNGIGSAIVRTGLDELRSRGTVGCALVGDPAFYGRFGFRSRSGVTCHGVPDKNVLCLAFRGDVPAGELWHHPAFAIEA